MNRELEVFAELWPILHSNKKSPAGTEDVKQTQSIIHEAQSYENQDALRTQI